MTTLQPPEEPLTPQGFSDLYARLRQPIERYISYMFNLSWHDAEDIAASAFENAFKALHPGRIVNQPTDWMYQIARRKAIDFTRHRRVLPMQSLAEPTGDGGLTLADTLLGPDDDETLAAAIDRKGLLAHIFGNLPPKYATIIQLYDHEGYSHDEIAGIMGITRSNSKTMLNRARDRAKVLAAGYLSGHMAVKRRTRLVAD